MGYPQEATDEARADQRPDGKVGQSISSLRLTKSDRRLWLEKSLKFLGINELPIMRTQRERASLKKVPGQANAKSDPIFHYKPLGNSLSGE
ncbi:MAG: hypothetical protein CMO80_13920 [Verrucomicrobiales bacterium]|nr:hypothetical protein [Verrucomicrobiales bacterium]|tara:strand:+ start:1778 stop:2050 length:273 start_codon:yes stop_codon:yes gene_type:complete